MVDSLITAARNANDPPKTLWLKFERHGILDLTWSTNNKTYPTFEEFKHTFISGWGNEDPVGWLVQDDKPHANAKWNRT